MPFRISPLASVVLLGWVIATSQTILLRETLAAAQGNELAIALALGQWLLLTAVGSAAATAKGCQISTSQVAVTPPASQPAASAR